MRVWLCVLLAVLFVAFSVEAQWQRVPRLIVQAEDGTVYLANGDRLDALILPADSEPTCVIVSPDGSHLIYRRNITNGAEVYLYDLVRRDYTPIFTDNVFGCPQWTPDSASVIFTERRNADFTYTLYRYDLQSGESVALVEDIAFEDYSPIFLSPDGTQLVYGNEDIFVYNFTADTLTNITETPNITEGNPRWLPDSESLLFNSARDALYVYRDGVVTPVLPELSFVQFSTRIAPNGTQLAMEVQQENGMFSIQISIYDLLTGESQMVAGGGETLVELSDWMPDSSGIIFRRFTLRDLHSDILRYDIATRETISLTDDPATLEGNLRMAPDGAGFAFRIIPVESPGQLKRQDDNLGIGLADIAYYDFADGAYRALTNTPDLEEIIERWSPDGRQLVISIREDAWDFSSGTLAVLDIDTGNITPITNFPADVVAWLG